MKINKRQIPGYELIDVIGTGGMGTVFKARQASLDKIVALKLLSPSLALDSSYVERFVREAKSLAKLNHSNVVTVIDVGKAGDHYYLVMEYFEGRSLADIIDDTGPLPRDKALSITRDIACALLHAQKHDLIHRDIKPDNILLSADGHCKLCDLGLARHSGGSTSLTAAGVAMGTPEYIAPEQARGESELDIRTDIYSLGATLYDMVFGKAPFDGPTPAHIMRAHIDEPLTFPADTEADPELLGLVSKMMAKEPDMRQQSAQELLDDIDLVRKGEPVKSVTAKRPAFSLSLPEGVRQHLFLVGGAIAAAIAAIILLAILVPAPSPVKPGDKDAAGTEKKNPPLKPDRKRGRDRLPLHPAPPDLPPEIKQPDKPVKTPSDARKAYEAALAFEENSGTALQEIIREYLLVTQEYPDTPWAQKALARIRELEDKEGNVASDAQEKYTGVQDFALAKLKEAKYHEALLALTSFASSYPGTRWANNANKLAKQLVASAARSFAATCREAQSLREKGEFEKAREILASLGQTGVPELDGIVDKKLEEITSDERTSLLREKSNTRSSLYAELLRELYCSPAESDIAAVLLKISEAASNETYAPIADLIRLEESDLRNALVLLKAAEDGLVKRIGSKEQLVCRNGSTVWGKITRVEDGSVTVVPEEDASRMVTIQVAKLDDRKIINLAAYSGRNISHINKFLFFTARGNAKEASKALAEVPSNLPGRNRFDMKNRLLKNMQYEKEAGEIASRMTSSYRAKRYASAAEDAKLLFTTYALTSFLINSAEEMGQYVPQTGLLRVHSKSSTFNNPLAADVDLIPSFTVDKQFIMERSKIYIRWEGLLNVPEDAEYTFTIMASAPVRLELGRRMLIKYAAGPEIEVVSDSRKLRKGMTEFELELTCPKNKSALVQVFWQRKGGARYPLTPADVLYLPARRNEYREKTK